MLLRFYLRVLRGVTESRLTEDTIMPIRVLSALAPTDFSGYSRLVVKLLEATLVFHYQHLTAISHPVHVVLGEVYAVTQDYADKLSEAMQGADLEQASGLRSAVPSVNVALSVDPMAYLTALLTQVQASAGTDPALANLVQELEGALCQKRYLLQLALRT